MNNTLLSRTVSEHKDPINVTPGFVWNENSKSKYQNGLQSPNVRNKINALLNSTNLESLALATELKNILWDNAKTSNLRPKKVPQKGQRQSEPWFDSECKNMKDNLNALGKKLKKAPGNKTTREALFQEKRNFRKIILAKKDGIRKR